MHSRLVKAALVAGLVSSTLAFGTVVIAQSIEEMAKAAPVVARGKVVAVQTRWNDGERKIWTYAELKVTDGIKGRPAGASVLVRSPGGEVGERGQEVSGAAKFAVGEDVLLFLEPAPDDAGVFNVWSLAAGKVSFEQRLGESRAVRHLEGIAFYQRPGAAVFRVDQTDLGEASAFVARVRAAAGSVR
jgi:hypothetical protein